MLFHFREGFEQDVLERFGEGRPSLLLVCEVGVVSRVAASKLLNAGLNADITVISGGLEAYCLDAELPPPLDISTAVLGREGGSDIPAGLPLSSARGL